MKRPIIHFDDYTFKYRSQQEPTLHNIDLTIYEGEKVLIVGPSGSGKSTIGHAINGLVPFSYKGKVSGSLKIKGREARDFDIFTLAKMVGTVLQDPDGQFIGLSVGEDIAFSLENDRVQQAEIIQRVNSVAKLVDIKSHLDHAPHELSGGQKQRVSLGGVMVDEVDILLFDEPLANLDPATGEHAIELIDHIQKESEKTVIIIEHRLEDVLHAKVDRVVVIDEGRVISNGTPDEVLASGVLEETYIREPLYVKAAKYAGCEITRDMQPAYLDTFDIKACKPSFDAWVENAAKPDKNQINNPILELQHVNFNYQLNQPVLQDISFTVHQGEMVSIVGKNGAGKSTLSKLICGFEKIESGKILYHEKDITNDTIRQRAERIGMVMQNPNQMISKHLIYDEVALGLQLRGVVENEVRTRVEDTLKICGLYPFRNWPISALSFGQKKRVTIASILVLNPEVLILDEPTAGQDLRHYTDIMEFLVSLNKVQGITVIMITHDMHLMLEYTPRAITIADGRIIADTTAVDVLTNEEVIAEANLKKTSLFDLAVRAELDDPYAFINRFIAYDRGVKATWQ
ncbi:ABC transporter ATP-binding protein [Virgibacillus doumboii]|uniref:ABC transporter ATP-binding protein n=1 Tax=Virgibacillus doumboii TaxID=2697503 RepID=UPI0013DF5E5F|nr:ABC transporter ATP-binding protein [Virgibacillus doumboii]